MPDMGKQVLLILKPKEKKNEKTKEQSNNKVDQVNLKTKSVENRKMELLLLKQSMK